MKIGKFLLSLGLTLLLTTGLSAFALVQDPGGGEDPTATSEEGITDTVLSGAHGNPDTALVITFDAGYLPNSKNIVNALNSLGYTVTDLYNPIPGIIASTLSSQTFQQVWLFDIDVSLKLTTADATALATWYDANARGNIIIDARSYGAWYTLSTDMPWIANEADAFRIRCGGLWIGTDHHPGWAYNGNKLLSTFGYATVTGIHNPLSVAGDTTAELLTTPNLVNPATLHAFASPGIAPTGTQFDGTVLQKVLWNSSTGWALASYSLASNFCYQPQPPTADADGPYLGDEGSPITFDGSGSSDPDGIIVSYEWDLDGDGQYDDATGVNPTFTWGDDYAGTIGLKVTDNGGLTDTDSTTVTVNNVAPTVDAGPDVANYSGQTHQLTATFTDPGVLDTHTATIDWGDGSPLEPGVVGSGTVTGSHLYFVLGSYTITVTVFDDDNGVGSDSLDKTVAPLPVQIDIKPGSYPNSINLGNKGNVPVGVFTGTYQGISFDAATIDRSSLLVFAGAPDLGIGKSPQDLDGDSDLDMVFHFATQKLNLTAASTQATLTGKTTGGIYFEGSDSVRIVPPK